MFKKRKWVAVVRDDNWVVAKVARAKNNVKVLKLKTYKAKRASSGTEMTLNTPPVNVDIEAVEGGARAQADSPLENDLASWLRQEKIPLNKLHLALSCPGVITRMITLPVLKGKELDKLLTEQVDQYFTLNIEDYIVDYRILERVKEDGQERQHILLAALPRFQWERFWSEWEKIGLKPRAVDLVADSLARLYKVLGKPSSVHGQKAIRGATSGATSVTAAAGNLSEDKAVSEDVAIIDLSSGRIEFVLLEHGILFLYSDLELHLEEFADFMISRKADAGIESAKELTTDTTAESGIDQAWELTGESATRISEANSASGFSESRATTREWVRSEIEMALVPVLRTMADFLSFFAARHFGKQVDRVYLTGEYANWSFVPELLESNLNVPVQAGFPHSWRPRFGRRARSSQKDWMKYGSLYGLALRED